MKEPTVKERKKTIFCKQNRKELYNVRKEKNLLKYKEQFQFRAKM